MPADLFPDAERGANLAASSGPSIAIPRRTANKDEQHRVNLEVFVEDEPSRVRSRFSLEGMRLGPVDLPSKTIELLAKEVDRSFRLSPIPRDPVRHVGQKMENWGLFVQRLNTAAGLPEDKHASLIASLRAKLGW